MLKIEEQKLEKFLNNYHKTNIESMEECAKKLRAGCEKYGLDPKKTRLDLNAMAKLKEVASPSDYEEYDMYYTNMMAYCGKVMSVYTFKQMLRLDLSVEIY